MVLLLFTLPAVVQAQDFTYTTNNGAITITNYTGSGGAVTIPSTISGLPVTSVGYRAFYAKSSLTNITIGDSVTNIGISAFAFCDNLTTALIGNNVTSIGNDVFSHCTRLTSITIPASVTGIGVSAFCACVSLTSMTIPDRVTSIGDYAFDSCPNLSNVTIPASVTSIGVGAFYNCVSLPSVTIPASVSYIGWWAFYYCTSLTNVYFQGNAPSPDSAVLYGDDNATVYYLPGTTGWGATFGGRPTALWLLPYPLILTDSPSFGVRSNRFGFLVSWATNLSVAVEACTNLANPVWLPLVTNTLTGDTFYFSDPDWTNSPRRFYRIRWP